MTGEPTTLPPPPPTDYIAPPPLPERPRPWWASPAIFFLGFVSYPLLFVPLCIHFAPGFLSWWIETYAEYLRMWGI